MYAIRLLSKIQYKFYLYVVVTKRQLYTMISEYAHMHTIREMRICAI